MSELVKQQVESKMVTLTIDGEPVSVPQGTLVVDAAMKAGIEIPVFCYHPKMEPVGMCRMCLVEIGRPVRDRQSGELVLEDDGSIKIQFGPKLETGCTVPVSEGMVVRTASDKVKEGRVDVLEFLLTSHPLDCPICDKGGECPLQNLTMEHGPGTSRYLYDEKMHLAKHVPLGDLIVLDRERCIQCARCTRFQDEVADDPVIGFYNRGRALEIVTFSDPGFDSYFSGNTTDICPVGALTTVDFRFGARPWELKDAASICPHCPVGCNISFNVRREAKAGGEVVIKRVMPRQNEAVNEIWMCDKGRFAYHFTESDERLSEPLVRKDGELVPASWEQALDLAAEKLRAAGDGLVTLAGGRLSNEDLFNLAQLTAHLGGKPLLYSHMAGGDLVAQVGVGAGTNFADLGEGDAILVVASDLEEEAPIWWLRVKQAAERGAALIVANPRMTKADRSAARLLRYPYGAEAALVLAMLNSVSPKRPDLPSEVDRLTRDRDVKAAAEAFAAAENAVVLFGAEGLGYAGSQALAQACANLLIATGHVGRPNNGLIGVWPHGNTQGAWDMGFRPGEDLEADLKGAEALYIAAADPAGDDPRLSEALDEAGFVVVQELFLTETARKADVVLPALAFTEREGSFTSGERRVQRYYPAVPPRPGLYPDFGITARLSGRLGLELELDHAARAMLRLAEAVPAYEGLTYQKLAEVREQWPIIGRQDVYYGGTSYDNHQGLGVQLTPAAQDGESVPLAFAPPPKLEKPKKGLLGVPVTRLYDLGRTVTPSGALGARLARPQVVLSPKQAEKLKVEAGARVKVKLNGSNAAVTARIDESLPDGVALVPRSLGLPISGPAPIEIAAE